MREEKGERRLEKERRVRQEKRKTREEKRKRRESKGQSWVKRSNRQYSLEKYTDGRESNILPNPNSASVHVKASMSIFTIAVAGIRINDRRTPRMRREFKALNRATKPEHIMPSFRCGSGLRFVVLCGYGGCVLFCVLCFVVLCFVGLCQSNIIMGQSNDNTGASQMILVWVSQMMLVFVRVKPSLPTSTQTAQRVMNESRRCHQQPKHRSTQQQRNNCQTESGDD